LVELRAETRGRLMEALFIVAGKLRDATGALREAPLGSSGQGETR
jgi:hypothetical protein